MKKVHIKVVSIEEEPKANGGMHLRIKVECEGKIYTFAVNEEDYMDKRARHRFQQNWIKKIKKAQAMEQRSKAAVKKDEETIKALVGDEVDESEY